MQPDHPAKTPVLSVNLLAFAFAGHATATLDIVDESVLRTRYFLAPSSLGEARSFAKYLYKWGEEYFIVYIVSIAGAQVQYIFKEPLEGETVMSGNSRTDELVKTIGIWQIPPPPGDEFVYVFDGYWFRSRELYEQIKQASWKDVILNEEKKKQITELMHKFFDSKEIYKDLGVSWKRGVIFHGIYILEAMHPLQPVHGFKNKALTTATQQDQQGMGRQSQSKH
jgi:hypothetical protein